MKGLYWALGFAGAGFGFYKLYWDTQKRYAQVIIKNGYYKSDVSNLLSYDKPYVKAWALAAQNGNPQFKYNGVVYATNGGKQVK